MNTKMQLPSQHEGDKFGNPHGRSVIGSCSGSRSAWLRKSESKFVWWIVVIRRLGSVDLARLRSPLRISLNKMNKEKKEEIIQIVRKHVFRWLLHPHYPCPSAFPSPWYNSDMSNMDDYSVRSSSLRTLSGRWGETAKRVSTLISLSKDTVHRLGCDRKRDGEVMTCLQIMWRYSHMKNVSIGALEYAMLTSCSLCLHGYKS